MTRTLPRISSLLAALVLAAAAHAQSPHTHEHGFSGAEGWAQVFDDPRRDAWQQPHEVIAALKLAPDATVADIGAGTGYFAVRFAHMVPKGRVYAVDLEPDMVRYLGERAKKAGLGNLTPVQGTAGDPRLPAPVDLAILVDVYHHVPDRIAYFRNLAKSLKPGGRLAIVDFTMDSRRGPPKGARVLPEQVTKELAQAGYAQAAEHNFLPDQFFLVFSRTP